MSSNTDTTRKAFVDSIEAVDAAIRELADANRLFTNEDKYRIQDLLTKVMTAGYAHANTRAEAVTQTLLEVIDELFAKLLAAGPSTRIIDHPNTSGDEALARDLGVSL